MMFSGESTVLKTNLRGNYNFNEQKLESQTSEKEEEEPLTCRDCDALFTSKHHLLNHLLHHIKQPRVELSRIRTTSSASLKITLKSKDNNSFEVVRSPSLSGDVTAEEYFKLQEAPATSIKEEPESAPDETKEHDSLEKETFPSHQPDDQLVVNQEERGDEEVDENKSSINKDNEEEFTNETDLQNTKEANVSFSPNFAKNIGDSPAESEGDRDQTDDNITAQESTDKMETIGSTTPDPIPGAEPTPPPEPMEYPKIRIKTTGLLKEPLTITEITDDHSFRPAEIVDVPHGNHGAHEPWPTPSLEDPLRLPESGEKDDGNILSTFLNNSTEQAKDFGLSSSESEFISLDRLDDRNRNALQIYNPSTSVQSSLESLTGLPMQQLAQQVSRLQPNSNNGMHQQNVLINIQQFPQAPPQPPPHGYQPPPMYPPHPGMQPPMYQSYQYPHNMYYPPQPNYPSHHMPPPPPNQMQQQQPQQPQAPPTSQMQPMTSQPMHPSQQAQYRQPVPQRAPAPRQYGPQTPRGPAPPRQPITRQRTPSMRPRMPMNSNVPSVRGPRPRMPGAQTSPRQGVPNGQQQQNNRMIKRTPEQMQMLQAKKRRMDVLVPDKNDDPDCQVIAVQPKNTDGGLPQIQSVQGGTSDPGDNSVMHLSDSITLSVRNPPKPEQQPKKSDAKAVANILATRGITVTATPKPKEKSPPQKSSPPPAPVAINLNSAVSIIPTAKNGNDTPKKSSDSRLQTVDLTDDSLPDLRSSQQQSKGPGASQQTQKGGNTRSSSTSLPHRCDLCPAQYPTPNGLSKHRQSYHKTGGPCEIGVPLVDLKNPGVLQKLSSLGIYNYIPLPGSNADGCFVLPVVSLNAAKNPNVCNLNGLGASSILTLGPVRSLPRPAPLNTNTNAGK